MMKKVKKYIYKIFLIISVIPFVLLLYGMLNSFINGFGCDPDQVSSFLLPKENGIKGLSIYLYYTFNPKLLGQIFIPIYLICILYQSFYFFKQRKNKKRNK